MRAGYDLRLVPVMLVVVGLFGLGLGAALLESVEAMGGDAAGSTLDHYRAIAIDREFHAALGLTIWVAAASTAISLVGGVGAALVLRRLTRGRPVAYAFLQIPLAVPHLAIAVGLLTFASPGGWVSRLAFTVGLISAPAEFPALVYDSYGMGIILAYVMKEVPFLAVVATALLLRLDDDHTAVARTLGASRWQRFRHVTWPMIAPGVGSAALLVFAFVFAAFDTPYVLGRPYPAMLSVVAQRRFLSLELADRPGAMAFALVMTMLAGTLVWAYMRLSGGSAGRERPVIY
ncbi:MAG: ABC transporter permease subunit [Acidobacteriota bacterium]